MVIKFAYVKIWEAQCLQITDIDFINQFNPQHDKDFDRQLMYHMKLNADSSTFDKEIAIGLLAETREQLLEKISNPQTRLRFPTYKVMRRHSLGLSRKPNEKENEPTKETTRSRHIDRRILQELNAQQSIGDSDENGNTEDQVEKRFHSSYEIEDDCLGQQGSRVPRRKSTSSSVSHDDSSDENLQTEDSDNSEIPTHHARKNVGSKRMPIISDDENIDEIHETDDSDENSFNERLTYNMEKRVDININVRGARHFDETNNNNLDYDFPTERIDPNSDHELPADNLEGRVDVDGRDEHISVQANPEGVHRARVFQPVQEDPVDGRDEHIPVQANQEGVHRARVFQPVEEDPVDEDREEQKRSRYIDDGDDLLIEEGIFYYDERYPWVQLGFGYKVKSAAWKSACTQDSASKMCRSLLRAMWGTKTIILRCFNERAESCFPELGPRIQFEIEKYTIFRRAVKYMLKKRVETKKMTQRKMEAEMRKLNSYTTRFITDEIQKRRAATVA